MARSGLFISYRRSDSIAWAGRLFGDLAREFGSPQVFMDISGSIPRGAKFGDTIKAALADCNALLALIGPKWVNCTRTDGNRRLDVADDWVRNEIATALKREITVVPVLLGAARLPERVQLPEDIQGLTSHEYAEVTDTRWDYDVGKLIDDLMKTTPLRPLRADITSTETGLRLLKDLSADGSGVVADAVSRSREVIEGTHRQLNKLDVFKRVHDALHTIEGSCLRPMQAAGFSPRVRAYRVPFATEAARIRNAAQGDTLNAALRSELQDRLEDVSSAFQAALDKPGPDTYQRVIDELVVLLSGIPSRLDEGMVNAAADLNLDRLVDLMVSVQTKLTIPASGPDASLLPLWAAVDAVQRLRAELGLRVAEHTLLQALDSRLRAFCQGGGAVSAATEWPRIRRVRSRLAPPNSVEVSAAADDLAALESEIDAAVAGDESQALPLLNEYFRMVSSTFRSADRGLLAFSDRLSHVSQPLKEILAVS